MDTKQRELKSWQCFTNLVEDHYRTPDQEGTFGQPQFLYRGQESIAWGLKPSLLRCFPQTITPKDALPPEQEALHHFKCHAQRLIPSHELSLGTRAVGWWILMQMYGVPTRLLDWTHSPYVGLYFAVNASPDTNGALWFYEHKQIPQAMPKVHPGNTMRDVEQHFEEGTIEQTETPRIFNLFIPPIPERIFMQQGAWSVCGDPLMDHETAIAGLMAKAGLDSSLTKAVIPWRLKPEFVSRLRSMNVTGASLFQGMEGLRKFAGEGIMRTSWKLARHIVLRPHPVRVHLNIPEPTVIVEPPDRHDENGAASESE